MIELAPLSFAPILKSVVWGGDKICALKGIEQPEPNIGESWEICGLRGNESIVLDGTYKGLTLNELIDSFGEELLGKRVLQSQGREFPLLIKIIDARRDLSIQVHPDDGLAKARHGKLGKTEMWYIIDTEPGAKIMSGLSREITPEEYVERVANGSFEEVVAMHESKPGDTFFIPAGRVHAIGGGNLLAEIQQSSDVTYRIYDYGRLDSNGRPRELHVEQAKDAIDYKVYPSYNEAPADNRELVKCDKFTVSRIDVLGNEPIPLDEGSFTVATCIRGRAVLRFPMGAKVVGAGHSVLIPAALQDVSALGRATILLAHA